MLIEIMKTIIGKLIQPNIIVKINKPASPKKRSLNWKKIIDNQIEDRVNVSKDKGIKIDVFSCFLEIKNVHQNF